MTSETDKFDLKVVIDIHIVIEIMGTIMATINNENLSSTREENKTSSSISLTTKNIHSKIAVSPSDCCQKRVYITERIGPVKNTVYHRICFKCSTCNRQLELI